MQNYVESRDENGAEHQRRSNSTKVLSKTTIPKTRTTTSLKIDHSKDKELINSGLHKLVSSFNTKIGNKASKMIHKKPEQADVQDSDAASHIVLSKQISVDKYTMTDFEPQNVHKLDLNATMLLDQPTYRNLFKKSATIPCQSVTPTEIMEEESDIFYQEHPNFIFRCLYYFCTASVSFIGSLCGIVLITAVLWKIIDESMIDFSGETKTDIFFKKFVRGMMNILFGGFTRIVGRLIRLLTIQTSEVLSSDYEETSTSWFR